MTYASQRQATPRAALRFFLPALFAGVLTIVGCGDALPQILDAAPASPDESTTPDAPTRDSRAPDAKTPDGDVPDAGCTDGATRRCYDGPDGTVNVGICRYGVQTCANGIWGSCTDAIEPAAAEICGDSQDNDCNGQVDEQPACECAPGTSQPCGSSVGACKQGIQYCDNVGKWSACTGFVGPTAEVCDGQDNDCDGKIDETLTRACYTGAGKAGVGQCKAGTQTCTNGSWGACRNEVVASAEVCDGQDNDCDGKTDEGLTRSCYTGSGTPGVGQCRAGTQTCNNGAWGSCAGQVVASGEVCDSLDNDCDGKIDEGSKRRYLDRDGDAYGTSSYIDTACDSDGNYRARQAGDCDDSNANARPGQTGWFTSARGNGSYDYNCDGAQTQRWTSKIACTGNATGCKVVSAGWYGGTPGCGRSGTWRIACKYDWSKFSCVSSGNGQATRTQACH